MKDIATQMQALDDFVTRARSQNAEHHDNHAQSLTNLSTAVSGSYSNIGNHFASTYERIRVLGEEMSTKTTALQDALSPLDTTLRQPLSELRSNIASTLLQEYMPTGETPQKLQYQYPTALPRTKPHENLLASLRGRVVSTTPLVSPTKTIPVIFNDESTTPACEDEVSSVPAFTAEFPPTLGLREINVNINAGSLNSAPQNTASNLSNDLDTRQTGFKRGTTGSGLKLPQKINKRTTVVPLEGRENNIAPVAAFSQSTGRRRSPRNAGLS